MTKKKVVIGTAMALAFLALASTLLPWATVTPQDNITASAVKNFTGNKVMPVAGPCLTVVASALFACCYANRPIRIVAGTISLLASAVATAAATVAVTRLPELGVQLFREESHLLTATAVVRSTPWLWSSLFLCILLTGGLLMAWTEGFRKEKSVSGALEPAKDGTAPLVDTEYIGERIRASETWDALTAGKDPTLMP